MTTDTTTGTFTVPITTTPTRLAPLAGIAFVACFIGGVSQADPPSNGASDRAWPANYTGSANKADHVVTGVLLVIAALSLLVFLTALWRRISDVDSRTSAQSAAR